MWFTFVSHKELNIFSVLKLFIVVELDAKFSDLNFHIIWKSLFYPGMIFKHFWILLESKGSHLSRLSCFSFPRLHFSYHIPISVIIYFVGDVLGFLRLAG